MEARVSGGGLILVTGATGYIGGRLVPMLLERGYHVRCLVRDPGRLSERPWEDQVEIVRGNATDYASLVQALQGVAVAYYLIHSLSTGENTFAQRDRSAALNFGKAAAEAGVKRIIYLGGLQPRSDRLSKHLASRLETGRMLREGGVPVTEFRAGVIVGSGSLSFELIRYLTERIPVLVTPRWVRTRTHPIAVRNVLDYLVLALEVPESAGKIIDIGGLDVLTYGDMFLRYAKVRGLHRRLIGVPVLTPRLSSYWIGFVTPISNRIARPLISGLDNEVIADTCLARQLFDVKLLSYEEAVRLALQRFKSDTIDTVWTGALSSSTRDPDMTSLLESGEGMIQERQQVYVAASPGTVFHVLSGLGGQGGWLYANWLWQLRGALDLLVGGTGLRRTRRSYASIRPGEAIGFWRVEAVEKDRLLRLRAEMKLPGRAWLQYQLTPENGITLVTQTAFYEPRGLPGFMYWWMLYLPHKLIFPGMLRELRRRSELLERRVPAA